MDDFTSRLNKILSEMVGAVSDPLADPNSGHAATVPYVDNDISLDHHVAVSNLESVMGDLDRLETVAREQQHPAALTITRAYRLISEGYGLLEAVGPMIIDKSPN